MKMSEHLRYAENCRILLQQFLLAHPDVLHRPFAVQSVTISNEHTGASSIYLILVHVILAEAWYVQDPLGFDRSGQPSYRACFPYLERTDVSVEEIFALWEQYRSNTTALVESLDEAGLQHIVTVTLNWYPFQGNLTAEQLLFQLFNHETRHLAQITMAMEMMNLEPPDFDYLFLHG